MSERVIQFDPEIPLEQQSAFAEVLEDVRRQQRRRGYAELTMRNPSTGEERVVVLPRLEPLRQRCPACRRPW